jgi:DNA-binding transcriptional ArsR family regulator
MVAKQQKAEAHAPRRQEGTLAKRQELVVPKRQAQTRAAQSRAATLDRLIHEPVRLGIVSALAVNDSMTFNELKDLLHTTDGNLSVHARKLEEGEYILCEKSFEGRMPKTAYRLSSLGRRTLETYLTHMEALIRATREG